MLKIKISRILKLLSWQHCNCNSLFDTTEKHIASTTIVISIHVICLVLVKYSFFKKVLKYIKYFHIKSTYILRIQRPGLLGILQTFITLVSLGLNMYYYELCNNYWQQYKQDDIVHVGRIPFTDSCNNFAIAVPSKGVNPCSNMGGGGVILG